MKRTFFQPFAAVLAVLAAGAGAPLSARDTNTNTNAPALPVKADAASFDLSSFKIISERNIFNPNRSLRGEERTTRREPDRHVRTESFALLGTMSYEKGRFAFFDGSNSDYRKVLQSSGQIGGFKITAVAPTCVRLETTNGQSIELCVGMQMTKREEEDWRIQDRPSSESSGSSGSSSASGSAESGDVLKRLMERRESEGAGGTASAPAAEAAQSAATTKETSAGSSSSSSSNAEPDEIVRRLLQKREQELNK